MPKISNKASMMRKLRSRPAYHRYNLRSKSKTILKPCNTCGVNANAVHQNCKSTTKLILKKHPVRSPKKIRRTTPCTICLDTADFKKCKKVKCGHEFHIKCINSWLKLSDSCPICRFQLRKPCLTICSLTLRVSNYLRFHLY